MLAKEIAKRTNRRWPAVQYELKQTVSRLMEQPEIASLFEKYPTPDEFYRKMNCTQITRNPRKGGS